jgi:hypothetical protein
MYVEYLNDLVARLNELNTPTQVCDVELLPNTESQYTRPTPSQRARLTLVFLGSKFGRVEDTGVVRQEETLEYLLICSAHDLYGAGGVYPIAEAAKIKLLGYTPKIGAHSAKKIQFKEVGQPIRPPKDNIWKIELVFTARHDALEVPDAVAASRIQNIITNPPNIIQ